MGNINRVEVPGVNAAKTDNQTNFNMQQDQHSAATDTVINQEVIMERKLRETLNLSPPSKSNNLRYSAVAATEARVKYYEDMKHKRAMRKTFKNLVESIILLLVLAGIIGGYFAWQRHKVTLEAEQSRIEMESAAERLRIEQERERIESEKREKMRLEREAMLAKQRAEREELEAENRRKSQERQVNKSRYQMFTMALRENKFDLFWSAATNKLTQVGGELCYLLPSEDIVSPNLYWVVYTPNAEPKAFCLDSRGGKEELAFQEFSNMLKNTDFLVARDDTVYFKSRKKNPEVGVLSKEKEYDPATVFFGSLKDTLRWLKPTYDELTFDIIFTPKGTKEKILVENLEFGCAYSLEHVREALVNAYDKPGISRGSIRLKKFNRTVKIWNGSHIKRGVDGITYVPRTPPPSRVRDSSDSYLQGYNVIYRRRTTQLNDRNEWASLYEQAQREEQQEQAFYERQRQDFLNSRRSRETAAESAWRKKLEQIFADGTISYKIRKKKLPQ